MIDKKVKTVLAAAVFLFTFVGHVGAFCVHNESDWKVRVEQVSGHPKGGHARKFVATLENQPGKKDKCCHYSEKSCNASGKPGDMVGFDVLRSGETVCTGTRIRADGDLYILRGDGNYVVCSPQMPYIR